MEKINPHANTAAPARPTSFAVDARWGPEGDAVDPPEGRVERSEEAERRVSISWAGEDEF